MDISLALRKRDSAVSALRDLYSRAESFGMSSADINSRFCDILTTLDRCPGWTREFVRGYQKCLTDNLYRYSLVHGGFYAGTFYSTHSKRADYYERNGIGAVEYSDDGKVTARGHYWIKHVDAGKPKPFFTMEQTNV